MGDGTIRPFPWLSNHWNLNPFQGLTGGRCHPFTPLHSPLWSCSPIHTLHSTLTKLKCSLIHRVCCQWAFTMCQAFLILFFYFCQYISFFLFHSTSVLLGVILWTWWWVLIILNWSGDSYVLSALPSTSLWSKLEKMWKEGWVLLRKHLFSW